MPSASRVPVSLSESTWFFGQPSVSTQKVLAIGASLQEGPAPAEDERIGPEACRTPTFVADPPRP